GLPQAKNAISGLPVVLRDSFGNVRGSTTIFVNRGCPFPQSAEPCPKLVFPAHQHLKSPRGELVQTTVLLKYVHYFSFSFSYILIIIYSIRFQPQKQRQEHHYRHQRKNQSAHGTGGKGEPEDFFLPAQNKRY